MHKLKITVNSVTLRSPDDFPFFKDYIEYLNNIEVDLKKRYPNCSLTTSSETSYYSDNLSYLVNIVRDETDEEFEKRKLQTEKSHQAIEDRERKMYLQLKAKFDP